MHHDKPGITHCHWVFCLCIAAALACLSGCTDMKFVDATNLVPEKDPREDIILTNVSADLTSGGLVQQRIGGDEAIFSDASQDLTIKNVRVAMIGSDHTTRSITEADMGEIYFADKPEKSIGRRDMRFAGNVLYRTPQAEDQTTDSMRMTSELVIWDESDQRFISPRGYEMLLLPTGRPPIRQSGKGFEAAQDLSRFVVRTGVITTELDGDPTQLRKEMEAQFQVWRDEVERSSNTGFVKPQPIEVPPRT